MLLLRHPNLAYAWGTHDGSSMIYERLNPDAQYLAQVGTNPCSPSGSGWAFGADAANGTYWTSGKLTKAHMMKGLTLCVQATPTGVNYDRIIHFQLGEWVSQTEPCWLLFWYTNEGTRDFVSSFDNWDPDVLLNNINNHTLKSGKQWFCASLRPATGMTTLVDTEVKTYTGALVAQNRLGVDRQASLVIPYGVYRSTGPSDVEYNNGLVVDNVLLFDTALSVEDMLRVQLGLAPLKVEDGLCIDGYN